MQFAFCNLHLEFYDSRKGGFTLIEILVALAILSIILVAVYSTFFLSGRAMEGIEGSTVRLRECRNIADMMRREIEAALYSPANKNTAFRLEDRDIYGKQASGLVFTGLSPLAPGLSVIAYSVEEKEGRLVVLKKMAPAYGAVAEGRGIELTEGIEGFTVEAKTGNQWVKTWNTRDTGRLPEELRITLTVLVKDRRVPIAEVVTPRMGRAL